MNASPLKLSGLIGLVVLPIMGWAAEAAFAQSDATVADRLEKQMRQVEQQYIQKVNPELNIAERAMVDVGALTSFGFLSVDDVGDTNNVLRQYDIQLYGYVNVDGVHEFFGRARFTYRDFNPGDSFRGDGDYWVYPFYDRLWYRFDLRRAMEAYNGQTSVNNLRLQVGRQYVDWASSMVLSEQLYAGVVDLEIGNLFDAKFLIGTTPESSVIDFDSSRPSFDGETNRLFAGAQLTLTKFRDHKPYIYVMAQRDHNKEDFATLQFQIAPLPFPPTPVPTRYEYNSNYWAIGSNGQFTPRLRYEIEGIYETGSGLSNSYDPATLNVPPPVGTFVQTKEDVEAWAARGQLSYHLLDDNMTRFELEGIVASGDDDRALDTSNTFGGNTSGTKDNAFNAFGYINTGLSFAPPISNLTMIRLGGSTYPFRQSNWTRRLQVGADFFVYGKTDQNAPFDEATTSDWFLGWEPDVWMNWRVASDVAIFVRYGVFLPGDAIAGGKEARHYFYSGVTYSF